MNNKIFTHFVICSLLLAKHQLLLCQKAPRFLNGLSDYSKETEAGEKAMSIFFNDISNSYYFANLLSNIGNNQTESTCGYVALAALLGYYDIYISDLIVSNNYEVNGYNGESDGTLHEPTNNSLPHDPDNVPAYYNYLRNYRSSSLHAFLILKDKDAYYFNPPINYMDSTYGGEFGTNESSLADLAYNYLFDLGINQYCTIVYNSSYNTGYSNLDIIEEIQTELYNNRPVIIGYNNHARIAYGYSVGGMSYYFHTHEGYIPSQNHPNPSNHSLFVSSTQLNASTSIGYLSLHFSFN